MNGIERRPLRIFALAAATLGVLAGCPKESPKAPEAPKTAAVTKAASQPSSQPGSQPAKPDAARRAEQGKARLAKTDAGKLVLASIEHHGGLAKWFEGGALSFHYAYRPEGDRPARVSQQTIDLLGARAYHTLEEPKKGPFAWDGERAWSELEGEGEFPVRFWALTPYYFVAMPFVLADPGVNLAIVDDDPKAAGLDVEAHVVKATFEPGTGDAPDDYYVVYLAKDDHRLLALRYIVSYFEGRAPKEKLLVYEDVEPAGPLKLARTQVTYAFDGGKRGEKVTVSKVSDVTYGAKFDASRLEMPEGATIDESK